MNIYKTLNPSLNLRSCWRAGGSLTLPIAHLAHIFAKYVNVALSLTISAQEKNSESFTNIIFTANDSARFARKHSETLHLHHICSDPTTLPER